MPQMGDNRSAGIHALHRQTHTTRENISGRTVHLEQMGCTVNGEGGSNSLQIPKPTRRQSRIPQTCHSIECHRDVIGLLDLWIVSASVSTGPAPINDEPECHVSCPTTHDAGAWL